ncbi:hypothetical protein HN937_10055 [Candidatus Poribacteria bacterium]|nr:hypothetical protein [Candidatus Poribacteria bacterium]
MLVYIFAAVFGVGVTLVDMLGLLGADDGDGAGGDDGDAAVDADGAEDGEGDGGQVHAPLLSMFRYLRMLVYFCLGFGPFGLVAGQTSAGTVGTAMWAVGGGLVTAVMARAFFRFQNKVVDSSLDDDEMLFERAAVTVPISDTAMGRIRVTIGQSVAERFALAADPNTFYATDDIVRIVSVSDDCVYVRAFDGELQPDEPAYLM